MTSLPSLAALLLLLLGQLLFVPKLDGAVQGSSRALSYQFGSTAANAGGHAATALRYRSDRLLFAAFSTPRSAPSGRYGLLMGYRPLTVAVSSWITFYTDISAGLSIVNGSLYESSASSGSEEFKVHVAPTLEALWGMRIGWLRVDIANHIYGDPQSLRPWSFPFWVGAVISW